MSAVDPRLVAAAAEGSTYRVGTGAPYGDAEAAVVQVPVELGERVEADVSPLGSAWLRLR